MKKNYSVSIVLIMALMMISSLVFSQTELLLLYKLDETSGTTAADATANGYDGTVVGNEIWAGEGNGEIGGAFEFDGSTNITLPADVMGMTSNLGSVAFWMKAETPTSIYTLFWAGDNTTGGGFGPENEMHVHLEQAATDIWTGGEISFFAIASPNTFLFSDPEKGGNPATPPVSPIILTDNEWHHVAAVWENNAYAKLYIDGVSIWDTTLYIGTGYDLNNIFLGQMGGGSRRYIGLMDDVRIFGGALSDQEVSDLYNKVSSVSQLQANEIDLSIYPNPATSNASVSFSIDAGKKISVNLFSVTGGLIGNVFEGISIAGKNVISLNTANYTPGIYFIELQIDNEIAYSKLVVQ